MNRRFERRTLSGRAARLIAAALPLWLAGAAFAAPVGPADAATQAGPPARLDPTLDPPQAEPVPIEREYDRFQDKTTVRVEGIRPTITHGESRLFINATSSCDGTEVTQKPDKVQINLLAVSDEFQYGELKDSLQLILLINNVRVRVPAKFVKAGTTRDRAQRAMESFVAIVDADVLVRLATAQTVEGQLGAAEFKLGLMEQLSLRRFAEAVKLVDPMPPAAAAALQSALSTTGPAGASRADVVALHLAQAHVDELQEKVDRLTVACLTRLEQSKDFVAARDAAAELEAKKDKTPTGSQRAVVSQQWLEARARVSLMKSSALLEDTELAAARRELTEAQQGIKAMQRAVEHGGAAGFPR